MRRIYKNIGAALKFMAILAPTLVAILAIPSGIVYINIHAGPYVNTGRIVGIGILIMFVAPVLVWLVSLPLYGFGELIDKVSMIEENTRATRGGVKNTSQPQKIAVDKNKHANVSDTKRAPAQQKVEYVDIEYIDIVCPECGENCSFDKNEHEHQCPWCDSRFSK